MGPGSDRRASFRDRNLERHQEAGTKLRLGLGENGATTLFHVFDLLPWKFPLTSMDVSMEVNFFSFPWKLPWTSVDVDLHPWKFRWKLTEVDYFHGSWWKHAWKHVEVSSVGGSEIFYCFRQLQLPRIYSMEAS